MIRREIGFHSNDARGTTITVDPVNGAPVDRVNPLVRSRGGEVAVRPTPLRTLSLDTFANFYRPRPELSLDADVSVAHARVTGVDTGKTHIPVALETVVAVVAVGITWQLPQRGVLGSDRSDGGAKPMRCTSRAREWLRRNTAPLLRVERPFSRCRFTDAVGERVGVPHRPFAGGA